jgi:hypothetical protein
MRIAFRLYFFMVFQWVKASLIIRRMKKGFFLASILLIGSLGFLVFYNAPIISRVPANTLTGDHYLDHIQPIFNARCIQCHACVNAPCQLNLTSYDGVKRGAAAENMATDSQIVAVHPNRLVDGERKSIEYWRNLGFVSVLGTDDEATRSCGQSLLYQYIVQGGRSQAQLNSIDQVCVRTVDEFAERISENPGIGMPYGLPSLTNEQVITLRNWIEAGAKGPSPEIFARVYAPANPEEIQTWEHFLNQGTAKSSVVSRYIYEHVYSAHIHFKNTGENEFYTLVRSFSPPSQALDEIVTEHPNENPEKQTRKARRPIYYRFKRVTEAIVQKSHITWEIDQKSLARLREIFFKDDWDYDSQTPTKFVSDNPFQYFAMIPARHRYQFMLENSRLIVNAMVRGPVCTGRIATYAIRDHFWVFFLKPESDITVKSQNLAKDSWVSLQLVSLKDLDIFGLGSVKAYYEKYTQALHAFKPRGFQVSDIWDGNGDNPIMH